MDVEREHGFRLAGARRHDDGGRIDRSRRMGQSRVQCADLRTSQTELGWPLVFGCSSLAEMKGARPRCRNRGQPFDPRLAAQRVDADGQRGHPPAFAGVECFYDLRRLTRAGDQKNELRLQRRSGLRVDDLQYLARRQRGFMTSHTAD